MCRGSIQSRFAVAAVPAAREKKAAGPDLENTQVCIDVCQRVVSALSQGFPVDVACATAGIGRTTFYRWLERAQSPDAPQALQTFRDGVLQAKRTPKKASGPSVAKPFSAITKPAAIQRSRKAAVACVAVVGRPKSTGSLVCEACSLHPRVDYVNYRYLPAQFRSNLLETIHSLARDFPLDKKLSELAGEERCVFESLVDSIAHSSCQLSSPISFSWYGSQTSVLFTDFEFARPIIHRLAARYIRDRQRHVQAAPSPAPVLHEPVLLMPPTHPTINGRLSNKCLTTIGNSARVKPLRLASTTPQFIIPEARTSPLTTCSRAALPLNYPACTCTLRSFPFSCPSFPSSLITWLISPAS